MKKHNVVIIVIVTSMILLGGNYLLAQDEPIPESKMLEKWNKFDTDKDGKISLDEFMEHGENPSEENFKRIDADGDGYISQEEFKNAIKKRN